MQTLWAPGWRKGNVQDWCMYFLKIVCHTLSQSSELGSCVQNIGSCWIWFSDGYKECWVFVELTRLHLLLQVIVDKLKSHCFTQQQSHTTCNIYKENKITHITFKCCNWKDLRKSGRRPDAVADNLFECNLSSGGPERIFSARAFLSKLATKRSFSIYGGYLACL